jgi:hypothetical protein
MPVVGARFTVVHFNLPAIDPSHLGGIFVVFLVDAAGIIASTSLDKTPL